MQAGDTLVAPKQFDSSSQAEGALHSSSLFAGNLFDETSSLFRHVYDALGSLEQPADVAPPAERTANGNVKQASLANETTARLPLRAADNQASADSARAVLPPVATRLKPTGHEGNDDELSRDDLASAARNQSMTDNEGYVACRWQGIPVLGRSM